MRKPQQITLNGLLAWVDKEKFLYAADGTRKRLYVTLNGTYIIEHETIEVWRGLAPDLAVEKYNEL